MNKYKVIIVHPGTSHAEVHAENPEAASDAALNSNAGSPSLCHQCTDEIELEGEPIKTIVLDENGEEVAQFVMGQPVLPKPLNMVFDELAKRTAELDEKFKALQTENDRLRDQLAAEVDKRVPRPIETAPRDEDTDILAYSTCWSVVSWQERSELGDWVSEAGWRTADGCRMEPTHWLPLPDGVK